MCVSGCRGAKWAVNNKRSRRHPLTIATFPVTRDYPGCPWRGVLFFSVMSGGRNTPSPLGVWQKEVRDGCPVDLNWLVSLFCCNKRKEAVCLPPSVITDRLADIFNGLHSSLSAPSSLFHSLSLALVCPFRFFLSCLFSVSLLTAHSQLLLVTYSNSVALYFSPTQTICYSRYFLWFSLFVVCYNGPRGHRKNAINPERATCGSTVGQSWFYRYNTQVQVPFMYILVPTCYYKDVFHTKVIQLFFWYICENQLTLFDS